MKTVYLLKGLPASGKSTYAKCLINNNPGMYKRISKDDLRAMLDNGKWSPNNEKFILSLRDQIILMSLEAGKHVIIDDCNLHPRHEIRIKQLIKGKAELEIEDFTSVTLEECIKRDLKRANSVGEKVIKGMYNQFLKPKPEVIEHNLKLPNAIICDIDGTLALFGDKNPYDRDFENDEVNIPVINIIDRYNNYGAKILLVSGRNGKYKKETEMWLKKNSIPHEKLFLREIDDKRKDVIVKKLIYEENIKDKFNILFVLDDRNQTVELWRSLGLPCLQVAEGDF